MGSLRLLGCARIRPEHATGRARRSSPQRRIRRPHLIHLTHLTHCCSSPAERDRRGLCNLIAPESAGSPIDGENALIFSLRLWCRAGGPGGAERRALEDWVRLRFSLAASDPMIAIIGAVGRLTDAGMSMDDATDTVLRILHERESGGRS